MKPKTARRYMFLIVLGMFALVPVYGILLQPLDIAIVDALFYTTCISLCVVYFVLKKKYYRCTKCGRSLTFLGKVMTNKTCIHCGAPIE